MTLDLLDTHQHLILRDRLGYAWTADVPPIACGLFDQAAYAADALTCNVVATLFMESGVDDADYQKEARLVSTLVDTGSPVMLGIIAGCRPETNEGFDAWLEECRDLNVVGFRRILQTMPDDLSRSDTFRNNIRKIGAAGYPVDLCFDSRQLNIAFELVRSAPDTRFVLDHLGRPDIAGGDFETWRTAMRRLCALPNLAVKLSGLTTYCNPSISTLTAIRPYAEAALDLFGPHRIIWGGDWPVIHVGGGLLDWVKITEVLLAELSTDERKQIGEQNARMIYLGDV